MGVITVVVDAVVVVVNLPEPFRPRPRPETFLEGKSATFRKKFGTLVPASEKPSRSRKKLPRKSDVAGRQI